MSKCPTCGAPVNLAPDGDPKYEPKTKSYGSGHFSSKRVLWSEIMRQKIKYMITGAIIRFTSLLTTVYGAGIGCLFPNNRY